MARCKATENRPEVLTQERGYELIQFYVNYNWNNGKYYSLRRIYTKEDCVQEIFLKLLTKKYFEQYDPKVTSDKYFIAVAVTRWFIDEVRKQKNLKNLVSLDAPLGSEDESFCLMDILPSNENFEEDFIERESARSIRNYIIDELPNTTNSAVIIRHENLPDEAFSLRNIALLMEMGYKTKEIVNFCFNPHNGKNISSGRLNQEIKALREFCKDFAGLI